MVAKLKVEAFGLENYNYDVDFKCIEALNLDGGRSCEMVADSRLLNRPAGLTTQRGNVCNRHFL